MTAYRDTCLKVGKWLRGRGQHKQAIAVLCVGALREPIDDSSHNLVAEALRMDQDSLVAKAAFGRLEGAEVPFEASIELDFAVKHFTDDEIARLDKEVSRPQFFKAQVGFNNNVRYKEQVFHVQTEDSGLRMPHIITHLFADGGRVIKSHKRSYTQEVDRPDVGPYVRQLMKGQHMEMVLALRSGRFDRVIAGLEMGGMDIITAPPQVDLQELGKKSTARSESPSEPAKAPSEAPEVAVVAAPKAPVRMHLLVLRSLSGGPERYEPEGDEVLIGKAGAVALADKFCHPSESVLRFREGEIWLEDREGGNGVFVRIRKPVILDDGDEFIVGDQLLRVEKNPERDDYVSPDHTYLWTSPNIESSFRVQQIFVGGAKGACRAASNTPIQIGKSMGDLIFADPLLSDMHCWIEEQAGVIVLADMHSNTGVFVRIRRGTEHRVFHGDEFIVGRTRLRLEIPNY